MSIKLANPADQRKGPNCSVTAVAIASGASFTRTWNLFKAVNPRRYGKRWRGGTCWSDYKKVFDRLGVTYESGMPTGSSAPLYRWADQHTAKDTVYLIVTSGHAQIVCNGMVADQSGVKPITEFWGRRKIVRNVLRILTPFAAAPSKEVPVSDLLPPMAHPAASSLFPALFPTQAPAPAECQLSLF